MIRISGILKTFRDSEEPSLQTVTFTLYRDQAGEDPLWAETQNIQVTAGGSYSALLGADTPDGIPVELFMTADARWLGVQVSGQEEQPLVMFVSVPYALKAADAAALGGRPPSSYVTVEQLKPQASERASEEAGSAQKDSVREGSGQKESPSALTAGCRSYIPKFNNACGFLPSLLYDNGLAVGLGTTTPRAGLDVNGQVIVNNRLTLAQDLGMTTPTWQLDNTQSRFRLFFQPNITAGGWVILSADTLGRVGIDHESPRTALDVNGEIMTNARLILAQDLGVTTPTWNFDNKQSLFRLYFQPSYNVAGSSVLSADTLGRVGIDHESPRGALDVHGEIITDSRLVLAQDLSTTKSVYQLEDNQSRFRLLYRPTINTGGQVLLSAVGHSLGILNDTPRSTLDVWGSITATPRLTLAWDTGTATPTWHIDNFDSRFRLFWQPDINTSGTNVMTATTVGNVGIGVWEPLHRLHVVGNIGVEGDGNGIVFPDGSIQTTAAGQMSFGVCESYSTGPSSCSCEHVLSETLIVDGETCAVSGISNPCTAHSTAQGSGTARTWGACCVCE